VIRVLGRDRELQQWRCRSWSGVAWHDDRGGEPRECDGNSFGGGCKCPDYVATIVPQGWTEIPAFDGMLGPRSTSGGFLMDENLHSGRGKRGVIEVKRTIDVGLGGQLWIYAGSSQQIESRETLREKFVPNVQR
jgi:hypothetical protein